MYILLHSNSRKERVTRRYNFQVHFCMRRRKYSKHNIYYFSVCDFILLIQFLDLVSVTNFLSAADEVWGMIIFLENYLLYDQKTTSIVFQEHIATTICHEIAHQVRNVQKNVLDNNIIESFPLSSLSMFFLCKKYICNIMCGEVGRRD